MNPKPEHVTVICDTREQNAFDLSPLRVQRGTLATADYSIAGATDAVAVERKELGDLIGCLSHDRERFERELSRMRAYEFRAVVIEGSWQDIEQGNYRSKMAPQSATASIAAMVSRSGVPFQFCGSRESAQAFTRAFLFHSARCIVGRAGQVLDAMEAHHKGGVTAA